MGYFSMLQLELDEEDNSYPSPEQQLFWRLEDLKNRLQVLNKKGASYRSGYYLLDDDVKYALPEDLHCVYYVERAIELAKRDLKNNYGIIIDEDEEQIDNEEETAQYQEVYEDPNQITIFDFIGCVLLQQLDNAA